MASRFVLIAGLDPVEEGDALWEKIKRLLLKQAPNVHLKGMVKEIHYQDVGLVTEDNKLTLVKLKADHEEHLDKLNGMELSLKSRIVSLPVQVTKRCEAKLDMDEISLMPDVTETMEFLFDNLGIELLKDCCDYWIAGELYQVTIAVKMLNKKYQKLPPLFSLQGSQEMTNSEVMDVQAFLNRRDWPEPKSSDYVEELDVELPYLVMMLCGNLNMMKPSGCKLILLPNAAGNKYCFKLTSRDQNTLAECRERYLETYHDTRTKYSSVALDSRFPHDYKDLLKKFVTAKFKPIIALENRKQHMTELVYHKDEVTPVETFINRYIKYNKPSHACNMTFFSDVLQRTSSHVEHAGVLTRPQVSGHGEDQSEYTGSDDGEPEVIETHRIHKDPLQLKYFYLANWEEFVQKTSYKHIPIQYKEGCLEMGTRDSKSIGMVEGMLKGITTKVIPVSQLSNYLSEKFLIVNQVDPGHVSITGPLDTEATDFNEDHQPEARSYDSPEQERLLAGAKEDKPPRRLHKLVIDNPERSPSPEINRPITPEDIPEAVLLREYTRSFQHPEGCQIVVGKGDITKLRVDAIVNSADRKLRNEGGLAQAIAKAAGPEFDQICKEAVRNTPLEAGEVLETTAGRLPCKWVIHAVAPVLDEYHSEKERLPVLRETFANCLIKANNLRCNTLAIPAITTGPGGANPEKVAKVAVEAIREYLQDYPGQTVKMIQLIDTKDDIIEFFEKEVKENLTV